MITLLVEETQAVREVISEDPVVSIGRGSDSAIVLHERNVSRQHALLRRHDDGYVLVDLGSHNGTQINREPVTIRPLKPGDEVRIGSTRIAVVAIQGRVALDSSSGVDASPIVNTGITKEPFVFPHRRAKRAWGGYRTKQSSSFVRTVMILLGCAACIWMILGTLPNSAVVAASWRPQQYVTSSGVDDRGQAEAAFRSFKERIARVDRVTDPLIAEAESLAVQHRSAYRSIGVSNPFVALVQDLRHRQASEATQALFDSVVARAEAALFEGRYREALRAAAALNEDALLPNDSLLGRVKQQIERDYSVVEQEGRRLEQLGDYPAAIAHYQAHASRFEGTTQSEPLLQRCEAARRLAAQ